MTTIWIKYRDGPLVIEADPKPIDNAFATNATLVSLVDSATGYVYRIVLSEIQAWSS